MAGGCSGYGTPRIDRPELQSCDRPPWIRAGLGSAWAWKTAPWKSTGWGLKAPSPSPPGSIWAKRCARACREGPGLGQDVLASARGLSCNSPQPKPRSCVVWPHPLCLCTPRLLPHTAPRSMQAIVGLHYLSSVSRLVALQEGGSLTLLDAGSLRSQPLPLKGIALATCANEEPGRAPRLAVFHRPRGARSCRCKMLQEGLWGWRLRDLLADISRIHAWHTALGRCLFWLLCAPRRSPCNASDRPSPALYHRRQAHRPAPLPGRERQAGPGGGRDGAAWHRLPDLPGLGGFAARVRRWDALLLRSPSCGGVPAPAFRRAAGAGIRAASSGGAALPGPSRSITGELLVVGVGRGRGREWWPWEPTCSPFDAAGS